MNTPQHNIIGKIMFLEQPKLHFLPRSRPPATNLARKDTRHNVPKICALWFIIKYSTPHLEANKYLSKILISSSCIFSKYYMFTDKKQKNENFLLSRFFLMWAWSYTVKIGFLRGFKTKIIKYKMQKVVK